MLTEAGCLARRERLWRALPDGVDWVVVADSRHVQYLGNFWVQPLSFSFGERALLLLQRTGAVTLLADNFTRRSAATEPCVDREVIETWYDHQHAVTNRDHILLHALKAVADEVRGRHGLVETEWLPLAAAEVLGIEKTDPLGPDLGSVLRKLRRQKEPDEIALMKLCMRATEAGHRRAREVIRPGVSELEVYREVQAAAITEAGRPAIVYGDFKTTNATTPKAGGLPVNGGKTLEAGDLFILDYSVMLDGYRSDFTNTYAVGDPSDKQRRLFDACAAALAHGETVLKAGVAASEVYREVSGVLEHAGFGKLGHHAGHGLGLGHPEPPILVADSTDTLLAGDVVTLEPGAYVEGIGGVRVEHNYRITADGCERLSQQDIRL